MSITHLTLGDHLVVSHPDSTGHGMLVGNNQVIHYQAAGGSHETNPLTLTSLEAFCQGYPVQKKEHAHRQFSREESVARAYASLGEHQSFANGEQFVGWCIDGLQSSSKLVPTVVASVVATEVARHTLGKAATTTAAGIAAATLTAATTGSTATTAVMASAASVVSAPIVVPLAVTVVTAYGVAKLWDWLTD